MPCYTNETGYSEYIANEMLEKLRFMVKVEKTKSPESDLCMACGQLTKDQMDDIEYSSLEKLTQWYIRHLYNDLVTAIQAHNFEEEKFYRSEIARLQVEA